MDRFWARTTGRIPDAARPAWELTVDTVRDSLEDRVPGLAAEAAFFALLSLPPMLLAIVGTAGLVARRLGEIAEMRVLLLRVPRRFLSADAMEQVDRLVDTVLTEGSGRIASIGFLVAIWAGSRAIATYINAIRIAYDIDDGRPGWHRRGLAVGLMLAGTALGVVVLPAMVSGPEVLGRLAAAGSLEATTETVLNAAFYPALGLVSVAVLASLYHVGVPWRTPWRRDLPGAVLAMILWLIGSYALRLYVAFAIRGSAGATPYGFLATPVVVLLWLYVTSLAVLLGAELNAEIEKRWPHEGGPDVATLDGAAEGRPEEERVRQVPTGGPS